MAVTKMLVFRAALAGTAVFACSSIGSVFVQPLPTRMSTGKSLTSVNLRMQGMPPHHQPSSEPCLSSKVAVVGAAVVGMLAMKRSTARSESKMQRNARGGEAEGAALHLRPDTRAGDDFSSEPGAIAPLGFWDPADLVTLENFLTPENFFLGKHVNQSNADRFRWYREAEIKHGRVAMMAAIGSVFQHYIHFNIFFKDVPNGLRACDTEAGANGILLLVIAVGLLEVKFWSSDRTKESGDFNDPLGLAKQVEENFKHTTAFSRVDFQNYEISNGRLAMFMAVGILAAESQTGLDAVQQMDLKMFWFPLEFFLR